jgi:subfamily B ATP-binding cassette protein MsbA
MLFGSTLFSIAINARARTWTARCSALWKHGTRAAERAARWALPAPDPAATNPSLRVSGRAAPPASPLRRFLSYVRPYWVLIAGATLCGILKFTLPAAFALVLRFMTDRLAPHVGPAPAPTDAVFQTTERYVHWVAAHLPAAWTGGGVWMEFSILAASLFAVYAVWGVAMYYRSYWADLAGYRVIFDLRNDLFQHIQRLSHSYFQKHQSGAIVSRITADIHAAQQFVGSAMSNVWMDLCACTFYLVLLFAMDAQLTCAALLVLPLHILCMRVYGEKSRRSSKRVQEALEGFSGDLHERIGGYALVKSFAAEAREARGFFGRSRGLHKLVMRNARLNIFSSTIVHWLTEVATLGLIWYGGYRVLKGHATVGEVVAFVHLLQQLYFPINRISEMNRTVNTSLAAIERVFEVFDTQPDVREAATAVRLPRLQGAVVFEHVSFGYTAQRKTLDDVELHIRPGEMVALVGLSGAGKSTLVQLIPRFFDPHSGRVLVDGIDVRQARLKSLRSQIGIVAQETLLFSGTIRDNIVYGRPDATAEQLEAVARAAYVDEFVERLPERYDMALGERGAQLSGGQRQRIAIARAFLADPRILILDEATSALDSESEHLIQDALKRLMQGRTSLVIAHRLSTILHADRIVVMDQGRIVQVGPHQQLLAEGGIYARLCERQFRLAPAPREEAKPALGWGAVAAG